MRDLAFTLDQLRAFIAVVDTGSMTRAAAELFVTQGAITQQIQRFEQALGLALLERSPSGTRLTEAGRTVLDACTLASRDLEAISEVAERVRTLQLGSIRIGSGRTAASHYLPRYLAEFCRRFPSIEFSVTVGHVLLLRQMVLTATLDFAITSALSLAEVRDSRLRVHELWQEELVGVVSRSHPLAGVKSVSSAELAQHRRLVLESVSITEGARLPLPAPVGPLPSARFKDPDAAMAATLQGLGYAVLPEVAVRGHLESGDLVRLPLPHAWRSVVAIRRANSRIPAVEEFWRMVTSEKGPNPP